MKKTLNPIPEACESVLLLGGTDSTGEPLFRHYACRVDADPDEYVDSMTTPHYREGLTEAQWVLHLTEVLNMANRVRCWRKVAQSLKETEAYTAVRELLDELPV